MKLTIYGDPRSKKNSQQIINIKTKTGKSRAVPLPSKQYRQYERDSSFQIPCDIRSRIGYPVNVKAVFWMKTKRKVDKSNLEEALHDMLVDAGVLADDCRDIIASTDGSRVFYDKDNPRVEIEITPYDGEYEQWKSTAE